MTQFQDFASTFVLPSPTLISEVNLPNVTSVSFPNPPVRSVPCGCASQVAASVISNHNEELQPYPSHPYLFMLSRASIAVLAQHAQAEHTSAAADADTDASARGQSLSKAVYTV